MLNSHWRDLYCDLFIFVHLLLALLFLSPFSQLTLTMVITVPPRCPFLCLAGILAQTGCPSLRRGRKYLSLRGIQEGSGEWMKSERRFSEEEIRTMRKGEWGAVTLDCRGAQEGGDSDRMWGEAFTVDRWTRCRRLHVDAQSDLPSALCACNVSIQELDWAPLRDCGRATSRKRQRA